MDFSLILLVASVILLTFGYWWFRQKSTMDKAESGEDEIT